MGKSITVTAETVEAAVKQALQSLQLSHDEVDIDILSNPARRLLGLRKTFAKVLVTERDVNVEKTNIDEQQSELELIVDTVLEADLPVQKKSDVSDATGSKKRTGARIKDGQIDIIFGSDAHPIIIPTQHVALFVNGEEKKEKTMILPKDVVTISYSDEIIPPQFEIQLLEQEMIAMLHFTPGKRIKRMVADTVYASTLQLEVQEEIEYFNTLKPQQIVNELKALGIQQGIVFPAIKKVTEVTKPYELIVARGKLPIEGTNGDVEIHIDIDDCEPDELEKVDFRELNAIATVKEGQIIATHIRPTEGQTGKNLLGKTIGVKPVRDVLLRLGKNVKLINENVVATTSGRPSVDRRDKLVKIEVNHEFHHPGEVNLESGNIRFEGDVRIGGNVQPSMFVGATGSITIGGTVSKATIHSVKSAIIRGNILSSTVSVGEQEVLISNLVTHLQQLTEPLLQMKAAIHQILLIRGDSSETFSPHELKQLIQLLLQKKYHSFEQINKEFIEKVKEAEEELPKEWMELANKLYTVFVNPLNKEWVDLQGFEQLIEEAEILEQLYGENVEPTTVLMAPYAINSTLYSNGNIEVTRKGVYHSKLTAKNDITIRGVCRGGELIAGKHIVLQEAGAQNPVKTTIKTSEIGTIKIGIAFAGTELQVGTRKYTFADERTNVFARLDEEGELQLYPF